MNELIALLRKNHLEDDNLENALSNNFGSSLPVELFENEITNNNKYPTSRRYSDLSLGLCRERLYCPY